jgi:hypothetical protein
MYEIGLGFPKAASNFTLHKFLVTVLKDELEDQALESFIDISGVISRVG